MSNKKLRDYINEFEELGKIRDTTIFTGEYKKGNAAYKKMEKIFELARDSTEKDRENFYLTILKTTKSPTTLIACCAQMLRLDVKSRLAKKTLKKMSKNKEIELIFASEAKLFLKEWEKGNIKIESQYKNIKL